MSEFTPKEIDRTLGELTAELQSELSAIAAGFGKMCHNLHKDFHYKLVQAGVATMKPATDRAGKAIRGFHEMTLTARGRAVADRMKELANA